MATLEDKILGEKLQNYCSSSEDEPESDDDVNSEDERSSKPGPAPAESLPPPGAWNGTASNTGPKGVIEDWRRYKQLETEHREELEKERVALAKKLTLTCRTDREDQAARQEEELADELQELMDDDFLLKYQKQRMQELMSQLHKVPTFGKVLTLAGKDEFLTAIDKEDSKVTVIVHIYADNTSACAAMDGCLSILAADYSGIKFCRIAADVTGLSRNFRLEGVPALLVYKAGQIIGNFVQVSSELGNDFFATDVERFLIEYGFLPEK